MNIKKVAILLPSLSVGGAEKLVYEELRCLTKDRGYIFEIHLVFEKGILFEDFKHLEIDIHIWNAPHGSLKMLATYLKLTAYLRKQNYDIIHIHLLNTLGPVIGRLSGCKRVITTAHSDQKYTILEKTGLCINHAIIACGKKVAENLQDFIRKEKIKTLSNAIGKPQIADRNPLSDHNVTGKLILLSIGSLKAPKGFDVLIRAFSDVKNKHDNSILIIAGEGKERLNLEDLIAELNLTGHVILLGNVKYIHSIIRRADIYINSSRREGLPMTLIEATAHGVPMVATNVGGNSEIVIEGKTGLLVEAENACALSRAICSLINDPGLRQKLGKGASELFREQYRIEEHCKKLSNIYLKGRRL